MTRGLFAAVVLVSAACAQPKTDRFPIEKIDLQGTVFPKAAVLRLTGLMAGEVVAPADFNAAAKKLKESGLFQNVEFRYGPGPANGYVLSFEITDFPELTPASIEVPEVNEDSIWKCAAERYAVVPKRVPADEAAERLYTAAIQQCLVSQGHSEEIVRRMSSSLEHRTSEVLFQPKNLPEIAGLEFTGVKALKPKVLLQALSPVAMGSGYTERSFRNLLRLNVVPLYEETGRLRTTFPKITSTPSGSTVTVTTEVDEGAVYTLGWVRLSGEGIDRIALMRNASFRIGQVANWNDILLNIAEVDKALRREGYLAADLTPQRHFEDAASVVNIEIAVKRGPQYSFGQLSFVGFPPELERRAREIWTLKPGSPMNQEYPIRFLKTLRDERLFNPFGKLHLSMEAAPAQNVMNVVITGVR